MTWKTICGAQMLGGLSARCQGLVWLKPVSVSSPLIKKRFSGLVWTLCVILTILKSGNEHNIYNIYYGGKFSNGVNTQ